MSSSGGGHGSGEVTYPDWFRDDAQAFLGNVENWVTVGVGGNPALEDDNPYSDVAAYDTSQRTGYMMGVSRMFRDYVSDFDPAGVVVAAAELADDASIGLTSAISPEDVDRAVAEFRRREEANLDLSLSVVKSGYNAINAVNSSAFILAQALLADELDRKVGEFDANLTVESKRLTLTYLTEVFRGAIQSFFQQNDLQRALTAADIDVITKILVAEKEEYDMNVHLSSKERLWPLQVHAMWANAFASLGGGTGMSSQEWHNSTEKSGIFGWGTFLL